MAFTVERREERVGLIERESENAFELAAAMPTYTSTEYCYLRLVDPYSDTWFSSYQMVAVIPELERLASEKPVPAVTKVLEMARRCRDERGTFLVFIGD